MAQTALQWFINGLIESNYITKDSVIMNEFIEEAEAMEKEQIKKAFSDGQELSINNPLLPHYSSKEYYNDTYKK